MPLNPTEKPSVIFEGTRIKVINNEGVLPPQITPVGERLSKFVEGWKHITNDPSVLSIVAKGYRLRFTSPPLLRQTPWEISSPQDPQEILGMREQITLTLQKNAITGVPREFSRVRRITYSWYGKLQEGERSHSRTSFPYVHDKLCAKLCSKRRLHVRNRPAGCVLSRTYSSQQQKVPQVHLRKQGVPVSSATVRSEHRPSGFYSIGAHGDRISAPSGDIGDTISRRLVDSPPRPPSFNPTSSSANKYARPCRLYSEQKEIRAGPDSGSPVPRNSFTSGPRGSFTSRVQSLGDSCTRTPSILPQSTNLFSSVPAYGVTQLGLRSYPPRSFVPETPSTSFSLIRSDGPVYATASIRPSGPCQPTSCGGWGIPRFRVPGPLQTASSISIVWSSKRSSLPYSIGLFCFRATRL